MRMLASPHMWDHLVRSELLACRLVQTILRMVSVVFQRCVVPTRTFPERMFQLAARTDGAGRAAMAEDIIAAPVCTKDELTLWFLELFPTVHQMLGVEATAFITSLMSVPDGHTYSTERAHSCNLRSTKLRVQTHRADLAWLAAPHQHSARAPWVGHVKPPKLQRLDRPRGRKRRRSQATAAVAEQGQRPGGLEVAAAERDCIREADRAEQGDDRPEQPKRHGAGGAWRAYLHSTGQKASAVAAGNYRRLSQEGRLFFEELGRQGTAAARAGVMGFGGVAGGSQDPAGAPRAPQPHVPEAGHAFVFRPSNEAIFDKPLCISAKKDTDIPALHQTDSP